jgi:hypothetical protein
MFPDHKVILLLDLNKAMHDMQQETWLCIYNVYEDEWRKRERENGVEGIKKGEKKGRVGMEFVVFYAVMC